ncbi:hypothetical protein RCL1_004689 [Eukaryota sp. TZLM3-RCL]
MFELLKVDDLHVCAGESGTPILKGVNLTIHAGETVLLYGKNGSGKSTLLSTIMGVGDLKVTSGRIYFLGVDITYMSTDERARLGVGMMFQRPPTVDGLQLGFLLNTLSSKHQTKVDPFTSETSSITNASARINSLAQLTSMTNHLSRSVNKGFSGGEIKRSESLQLLLTDPTFVMLDEPESGVDVENLAVIGQIANTLLSSNTPGSMRKGGLVVTHTGFILDFIQADIAYVMVDGRLSCSGDPKKILSTISKFGYDPCQTCAGNDCSVCLSSRIDSFTPKQEPVVHLTVEPTGTTVKLSSDVLEEADIPKMENLSRIIVQSEEHDAVLKLPENSGEYLQRDCTTETSVTVNPGIEVLPLKEALAKYHWMEEYMWKVVKKENDHVTRHVADQEMQGNPQGYVIIAHEGVKCEFPVEANLRLESVEIQHVHNILIARPNSELHVISGCTCSSVAHGKHYGISEFYVEDSATITFSMIHRWCSSVEAYPRSASRVGRNGTFISNYVCLSPVTKVQLNPLATLGEGAAARFNSIILAREGTTIDAGSRVDLQGKGSSAEIISRIISNGGHVIARAWIAGNATDTKGHVECQGLLINEDDSAGKIWALPQIDGNNKLSELSHEASVGRIGTEKIQYLQSRGLTEQEATSAIVSGFLNLEISGVPQELKDSIKAVINTAVQFSTT